MNIKINESYNFLLSEYKRLKLKEKNGNLSIEEKETLRKLESFLGKSSEEKY